MFLICSFDDNKLKFQVLRKSLKFELRYAEIRFVINDSMVGSNPSWLNFCLIWGALPVFA